MSSSSQISEAGAPAKIMPAGARWQVLIAGFVLMLCLGGIYSWSLYPPILTAGWGWSATAATLPVALGVFCVGLGAASGGALHAKLGMRATALLGVAAWGLGNIVAGIGAPVGGAAWLYLFYGLFGGFGVGMGYITAIAVTAQWFPTHKGRATGVVVAGFAGGAILYSLVVKALPSYGATATAALLRLRGGAPLAPDQVADVLHILVVAGLLTLLVGLPAAYCMRPAPLAAKEAGNVPAPAMDGLEPRAVLRQPAFYMLWSMLFVNVLAGLMLLAHAVPILQAQSGVATTTAAGALALATLGNLLGRVVAGTLTDRLGARTVFFFLFAAQVIVFALMGKLTGLTELTLAVGLVMFCFGGGFAVMPMLNVEYFGLRYVGANYGLLLTAWGVAGLLGPLLAARIFDLTDTYGGALLTISGVLFCALLLPVLLPVPKRAAPEPAPQLLTGSPLPW